MIINKPFFLKLTKPSFLTFVCLLATNAVVAQDAREEHAHHHDHMQHNHNASQDSSLKRSVAAYKLPDVNLVREDGKKVKFVEEMQDARPVYLNFIYTSCTAVCPVMSQIFASLQNRLGNESSHIRMVSVSIDPEQDTPARLNQYARQYNAGPQWHFYTGSVQASTLVQKAFDVYNIDKMNHTVVTFFRARPDSEWVRLDGFAMPDQLLQEYSASTSKN